MLPVSWQQLNCRSTKLLSQISSLKKLDALHFLRKFKNTFSWCLCLTLGIGNILAMLYKYCLPFSCSCLNILQIQPIFHSCFTGSETSHCQLKTQVLFTPVIKTPSSLPEISACQVNINLVKFPPCIWSQKAEPC